MCDIQTNSSHRTITPSGSPYIPKLEVLENEYPFNPAFQPIPLPLAPQNIIRIVLRIDEDMSVDIRLKSTTDFLILVHILEKEPSSTVMYNFGVGPRFAFVSASARAPK